MWRESHLGPPDQILNLSPCSPSPNPQAHWQSLYIVWFTALESFTQYVFVASPPSQRPGS